ncbi:MAG: S46 family peptidase [Solitalea-like symbiont of Acarus siro]
MGAIKIIGYGPDIQQTFHYLEFTHLEITNRHLIRTPPENLGKFGGNKDNWIWPRHTADFSLFRIYASGNNEPAPYSELNVPYIPKKFIKVSLKGYDKNSFSLIKGYPGSTNRYATSFEIAFKNKKIYPAISSIRGISMAAWDNEMQKSASNKLQLSNIYQGISNYEKYYKGLVQGITKREIIQKLEHRENTFMEWSNKQTYIQDYSKTFTNWRQLYDQYSDIIIWKTYSDEIINSSPILRMAVKFLPIGRTYNKKDYDLANVMVKSIQANELFENFNYKADMEILPSLMLELWKNTTYEHLPKVLDVITEEYGDDALEAFQNYTHEAFLHSIFASKDRYNKFLERSDTSKSQILLNDPIYKLVEGIFAQYDQDIGPKYEIFSKLEKVYRTEYILGLQLMNPNKLFYPDANLTPRITYGKVRNYDPIDGVEYNYFTTTEGLIEKNLLRDPEYKLSQTVIKKLKKANESKYIDSDGKLHVCFITDNDITGGNSGSPILNDKLELIGVAFDGNWESITGQIYFDPNYNRTIGVDIRFILWCIDNLADAKHLVKEILYGS